MSAGSPTSCNDADVDDDQLRGELRAAALDARAKEARREVCRAMAHGFPNVGESLRAVGHVFGPQRVDGTDLLELALFKPPTTATDEHDAAD